MVFCLTAIFKTCFKRTCFAINHHNCTICLWSSSNHIWNKISVTWCINYSEIFVFSTEKCLCNIDSNTTFSFFLIFIHDECVLKRVLSIFFTQLFILCDLSLFDYAKLGQQMSRQSTFSAIYMPNYYHVYVLLCFFYINSYSIINIFINLIQLFCRNFCFFFILFWFALHHFGIVIKSLMFLIFF